MSLLRRDRIELEGFAFEFTSDGLAFIEMTNDHDPHSIMELDDMISLEEWLGDAIKYKQTMNERADAAEIKSTRRVIQAAVAPDTIIPF